MKYGNIVENMLKYAMLCLKVCYIQYIYPYIFTTQYHNILNAWLHFILQCPCYICYMYSTYHSNNSKLCI